MSGLLVQCLQVGLQKKTPAKTATHLVLVFLTHFGEDSLGSTRSYNCQGGHSNSNHDIWIVLQGRAMCLFLLFGDSPTPLALCNRLGQLPLFVAAIVIGHLVSLVYFSIVVCLGPFRGMGLRFWNFLNGPRDNPQ